MRKIFILALAAFMFAACAKQNDKMVNAQMVNVLSDYHAHAIPDSYRELVARHGMSLDEGFPLPQWSVEAHRQMMTEAGIDRAILTLPNRKSLNWLPNYENIHNLCTRGCIVRRLCTTK